MSSRLQDAAPSQFPSHRSADRASTRSKRWLSFGAYVPLLALVGLYLISPQLRSNARSAFGMFFESSPTAKWPEPTPEREKMMEAADLIWKGEWAKALAIYEYLHEEQPDSPEVAYGLALCRHNLADYDGAIEANLKAIDSPRYAPDALYHLAGEYAVTGKSEEAIDALYQGMELGYRDFRKIANDPALDPIRYDPRLLLPPAPQILTHTLSDGTVLKYALVLPRHFDPDRTYPALLGISRSRQRMNAANFALDNYWGLQAHYRDWIVISPIAPVDGGFVYTDAWKLIPELLDHVQSQYTIEGDRFHLAGFSNGGSSCFKLAIAFPERFQSVTTFPCYEITESDYERLGELKGLPIALFYGSLDSGPSIDTSIRIHKQLTKLGVNSSLTVFEGEPHEITSLMGQGLMKHLDSLRPADRHILMARFGGP